jgi:hypothetical protein
MVLNVLKSFPKELIFAVLLNSLFTVTLISQILDSLVVLLLMQLVHCILSHRVYSKVKGENGGLPMRPLDLPLLALPEF